MGLNIALTRKRWVSYDEGVTHTKEYERLFDTSITHNLGYMAGMAGLYEALWRPYRLKEGYYEDMQDEHDFETSQVIYAHELIPYLEKGIERLISEPDYFKGMNPTNGWGSYELLLKTANEYLEACHKYPYSLVSVDR